MKLILDLPENVLMDLNEEAAREGTLSNDHAILLLDVIAMLHDAGKANTPFQAVIKPFLSSHAVDTEQFASLIDEVVRLCVTEELETSSGPLVANGHNGKAKSGKRPITPSKWPPKYFDQTYGSLKHAPLERLPQGKLELRESLE